MLDKAQRICFKKKSNTFHFERKFMSKFKKSASVPTEHASSFIDNEQSNGQTVSLYVSDPSEYRVKPKEPFVLLFYRSLLSVIVDKKLTTTDLKVILTVLDFVSQGNVVSLTHQDVANKAKLVRQQVTNSLRKLVGAEILLKTEGGSLLLNPNLIAKENLKEMKATEAYKLAAHKTPKLAF
ncbi:MAG: replication/maintenance protein RepL [Alphaproteobacteria bacterium]|nr:replication/maintenance protein RepL [Alphaproteobacteria bacterium]